jgi:hypothetical protein
MDEIPADTMNFEPTPEVMVPDEGEVFWPIFGPTNSTEVVMITGIKVHMTWSDDENPPLFRPFYQNLPDTMTLGVTGTPYLQSIESGGNTTDDENNTAGGTVTKTSMSDSGTTRVDLDLRSTPIVLGEGSDTNLSFDQAGTSDPGNSGLYISVSCIAGHIESTKPSAIRYLDQGDEVILTISITYKRVPSDVFEAWVEEQTHSSDW